MGGFPSVLPTGEQHGATKAPKARPRLAHNSKRGLEEAGAGRRGAAARGGRRVASRGRRAAQRLRRPVVGRHGDGGRGAARERRALARRCVPARRELAVRRPRPPALRLAARRRARQGAARRARRVAPAAQVLRDEPAAWPHGRWWQHVAVLGRGRRRRRHGAERAERRRRRPGLARRLLPALGARARDARLRRVRGPHRRDLRGRGRVRRHALRARPVDARLRRRLLPVLDPERRARPAAAAARVRERERPPRDLADGRREGVRQAARLV